MLVAGGLFVAGALGLLTAGCYQTEAIPCGDEHKWCPRDTACTPDQDPPRCVPERGCGNGKLDGVDAEVCDDGNVVDGDGCDEYCFSEEL